MDFEPIFSPKSIVVIGASRDPSKIGGKILKNIAENNFSGALYGINPKETDINGIPCPSIEDLPDCDLAILCVPAALCEHYVTELASRHGVRGFIITSAGFGEMGPGSEGEALQKRILATVNEHDGILIGPNCTGILTRDYAGIFAGPVPLLDAVYGCDFVSGSGATAAFVVEQGITQGLPFSQIITVGNSAQIGVEDILAFWDEKFDPETDGRVKLLYLETIRNPKKFLEHAASLTQKGCLIAAVKAGTTAEGRRAASSHTGALATPTAADEALFRKAGIIRCRTREELVQTAVLLCLGIPPGNRIGIVTHAGGPGVLLADSLSRGGFSVPELSGNSFDFLLGQLYPGASVKNPIDFLATGTADQLELILDTLERSGKVDAAAVIFGSPGLTPVDAVYTALGRIMEKSNLLIYPVFPSMITAAREMAEFTVSFKRPFFLDEGALGSALQTSALLLKESASLLPSTQSDGTIDMTDITRERGDSRKMRFERIQQTADKHLQKTAGGYLTPASCTALLKAAGIPVIAELLSSDLHEVLSFFDKSGGSIVLKVVGPLHKSDAGGVYLNLKTREAVQEAFNQLICLPEAIGVQAQPMVQKEDDGQELFVGAIREPGYGHLVFCGMGGIFIEVFKDTVSELAPVGFEEAQSMIERLKSFPLFTGTRGKQPLPRDAFADCITAVSDLVTAVPAITEIDINPLIAARNIVSGEFGLTAVDVRIRVNEE